MKTVVHVLFSILSENQNNYIHTDPSSVRFSSCDVNETLQWLSVGMVWWCVAEIVLHLLNEAGAW